MTLDTHKAVSYLCSDSDARIVESGNKATLFLSSKIGKIRENHDNHSGCQADLCSLLLGGTTMVLTTQN